MSDAAPRVIEPVRGFELPDLRELWEQRDVLYYLARRAISAPPRRPEQRTFIPSQPTAVACCRDFFIARRKCTRRMIWKAIWSATNWASTAGSLTYSTSITTSFFATWLIARFTFSISCPRRPMITPGREVLILTRSSVAETRSMMTCEIEPNG